MDDESTVPRCIAKHGPRKPYAGTFDWVGLEGPVRVPVIFVPMEDGEFCVVERAFFAWLMAQRYTDQFFYSRRTKDGLAYVCTSHESARGKPVRVHRLVYYGAGPVARTYIGFHNQDTRVLLRDNLGPVKGRFRRPEKNLAVAA